MLFGHPVLISKFRVASSVAKFALLEAGKLYKRLLEQVVMIVVDVDDAPLARVANLFDHDGEGAIIGPRRIKDLHYGAIIVCILLLLLLHIIGVASIFVVLF